MNTFASATYDIPENQAMNFIMIRYRFKGHSGIHCVIHVADPRFRQYFREYMRSFNDWYHRDVMIDYIYEDALGDTYRKRYDDVIEWKHFPRYWPFGRGIPRSPANFPHIGH